ncbi:MAG: thioredoxin family protein [Campylobacterota bacterium]|nr:thioredoxin family protein [Campylobacterota bacterium]
MKYLFLIFLTLLLSLCYADGNAENLKKERGLESFQTLKWQTQLDKAFQIAHDEQKNVIVMVEDRDCKWCIKMKKGALSDTRVQARLKHYVLVKVSRSNKAEVNQLQFFDGTIPNFYFMTPKREIVENIVGYFRADDFLGYIKEIEEEGF